MIYRNSGKVSGQPPLNFKNYSGSIQDYLIEGNTSQNGTPTPSDPVEAMGCGEKTENLFDPAHHITIENADYIGDIYPANKYRINNVSNFPCYYKMGESGTIGTVNPTNSVYLNASDIVYIWCSVNSNKKIGLTEGTTVKDYEPYGYKLPLTVNGTEYPIYLGQVETTRRIKKLVLTGNEGWTITSNGVLRIGLSGQLRSSTPICTHYLGSNTSAWSNVPDKSVTVSISGYLAILDTTYTAVADFKVYLAQQYANGTPVTVWYVLATPETSITNEPLHKIGTYADTITYSQSNQKIPTIEGTNTISTLTTVQPSNISVSTQSTMINQIYAAKRVTTTGAPPLSYPSKGYDLEDFLISGNTVQDGTPTPEAPVDVVGCGVRTAQLFEDKISSCSIDASGRLIGNPDFDMYLVKVEQGETYTASGRITGGFFVTKPVTGSTSYNRQRMTFAPPTITAPITGYMTFRVNAGSAAPMLNTGSTALPYEPYGYKLPITVNGTEYPIFLGQVETTRRIKKLVLTGEEEVGFYQGFFYIKLPTDAKKESIAAKSTHFYGTTTSPIDNLCCRQISSGYWGGRLAAIQLRYDAITSYTSMKYYLQQQYAAGTPVTVWYVLAEPETGIVNEPLMKIGNYADTISLSQSGITISTTAGTNTITTETTVLPSSISVTTPEREVEEIYAGINYQNPVYYKSRTLTGTSPLTFKGLGQSLKDWRIYGETLQNSTPSPEAPVDVVGCGDWDATAQQYKLPLTINGTEYPIYLGQVETTRRIKKLVLTGKENWQKSSSTSAYYCSDAKFGATYLHRQILATVCTHYKSVINAANTSGLSDGEMCLFASTPDTSLGIQEVYVKDNNIVDAAAFKTFLATQYANGTPVTIWYVLAEQETGIVNEPLHRIGDYADTVSFAQAEVAIPTSDGDNIISFGTTVQPSSMSITGNIKSN